MRVSHEDIKLERIGEGMLCHVGPVERCYFAMDEAQSVLFVMRTHGDAYGRGVYDSAPARDLAAEIIGFFHDPKARHARTLEVLKRLLLEIRLAQSPDIADVDLSNMVAQVDGLARVEDVMGAAQDEAHRAVVQKLYEALCAPDGEISVKAVGDECPLIIMSGSGLVGAIKKLCLARLGIGHGYLRPLINDLRNMSVLPEGADAEKPDAQQVLDGVAACEESWRAYRPDA